MIVLDPGHYYELHVLDQRGTPHPVHGEAISRNLTYVNVRFVKRQGDKYPGNIGTNPGTILQECWRMEIDRLKYVNAQVPHPANDWCITNLRQCIYYLEIRAAARHGAHFVMHDLTGIENLPICPECGHIFNHIHEEIGKGVINQYKT